MVIWTTREPVQNWRWSSREKLPQGWIVRFKVSGVAFVETWKPDIVNFASLLMRATVRAQDIRVDPDHPPSLQEGEPASLLAASAAFGLAGHDEGTEACARIGEATWSLSEKSVPSFPRDLAESSAPIMTSFIKDVRQMTERVSREIGRKIC
jgi:hypothetical protein